MTVLRLEPVAGRGIDLALAAVDAATLVRTQQACLVEVEHDQMERLVRALAFRGIRAEPAAEAPPPRSHPAIGLDLAPLPAGLLDVDVVRIRRLALGDATREIMRRRLAALRPPSPAAQRICRAVLRGEDALFAWERRAWAARPALRDARAWRSLRPVVFDRAALERATFAGRARASDGALASWLFG